MGSELIPGSFRSDLERQAFMTDIVQRLENEELTCDMMIARAYELRDDDLIVLLLSAFRNEQKFFLLRGKVTSIIMHRLQRKFQGGHHDADKAGVGVTATITQLATRLGCVPATLFADARIYDRILCSPNGQDEKQELLPRRFYIEAVKITDPEERRAAVAMAWRNFSGGNYSAEDFKEALGQNKTRSTSPNPSPPDLPATFEFKANLSLEMKERLDEVCAEWKVTTTELIEDFLRGFLVSLSQKTVLSINKSSEVYCEANKKEPIPTGEMVEVLARLYEKHLVQAGKMEPILTAEEGVAS